MPTEATTKGTRETVSSIYRLSVEARATLVALGEALGINQTAVVELALRHLERDGLARDHPDVARDRGPRSPARSITLSRDGDDILWGQSGRLHLSRTAVIELAVRRLAREEGVTVRPSAAEVPDGGADGDA